MDSQAPRSCGVLIGLAILVQCRSQGLLLNRMGSKPDERMNSKDFEPTTEWLLENAASFARCASQAIRVVTHDVDLCPAGAERQRELPTSPAAFTPPAQPDPAREESEDEDEDDEEEEEE